MRFCIGFALISSVIDRESLGHPLNQSDVKIKNLKKKGDMGAHVFPYWLVFTLSLHWLFFQENSKEQIPSSVRTRPFKKRPFHLLRRL